MKRKTTFLLLFVFIMLQGTWATKLVKVQVVDQDYLLVHFKDGDVEFVDDGLGEHAFGGHHNDANNCEALYYGTALSTSAAANTGNWLIKSGNDSNYGGSGRNPSNCYRKSKLNGMAQEEWSGSDFVYDHTMEHFIYLRLPSSLQQGNSYTLEINGNTNTDVTTKSFTFDIFNSRSEAVRVNLVGFTTKIEKKAADLYMFLGDAGTRDYSSFEGNKVYIYDVNNQTSQEVGTVSFWKSSSGEAQGYNLTGSDVWTADFSSFNTPGNYRVAIEGVGCSEDFVIDEAAYYDPFKVSVQGYYYMRIGEDMSQTPVPRQPRWIPNTDPADCKVYITTMHPHHSNWGSFSSGDAWDNPDNWKAYVKSGSPTNPNAIGGHSDALDWDRHLGHVANAWDLLLPFILTNGAISDDNLSIAESGNGIPDILDEARNEVDFWLNLRDGDGYSHGLTNPNGSNELFQAGNTPMAAWANAVNAAMLSNCFKIDGNTSLMEHYRDEAIAAYNHANNQMLDVVLTPGASDHAIRGSDMKMIAAAYLYNVTGNTQYETDMKNECVVTSNTAEIKKGSHNQIWGVAAYLLTDQPVNYSTLYNNMKQSVIYQAKNKEANFSDSRPSRRATDNQTGYFWTNQDVHRSLVAHAVADNPTDKQILGDALALEADFGLGRNPLNIIYMTTATTSLESKRSIENCYTSGRDDGSPGLHPGHTPYLNHDDWAAGMIMGRPSWMTDKCYPSFGNWPKAEGYFNTRYVWAHVEFTPRQTMRGKMALYGYLYGLGGVSGDPGVTYTLSTNANNGSVTPSGGTYDEGASVQLTADPDNGYEFDSWNGDANGTSNPINITMDSDKEVTANFTAVPTYTLTVNSGTGDGEYSVGYVADIAADSPPSGQQFAGWTGDVSYLADANSASTAVTMPAANVSVTAIYEDIPNGLAIPGKIEAEDYTAMSGIQTQSTSDYGGGENIGWVDGGDWLDYEVEVATAGDYEVVFRIASKSNGTKFDLKNGSTVLTSADEPATGDWQIWTSVTKTITLQAGVQTLRIEATGGGWNLNWIDFTETISPSSYTLNVTNGSGDGEYEEQTVVDITADTPPTGKEFDAWTGDIANVADVYNANTSITMPSANVSITATYRDKPNNNGTITIRATLTNGTSDILELRLDDETVKIWNIGSYYEEYSHSGIIGSKSVKIFFQDNGTDAKLDYINVGGTVYQAEDQAENTSAWDGSCGGGSFTENMHCAGYIGFGTINFGDSPDTYTLTVNSGTGDGAYGAGTVINISADAAPGGQQFANWTGDVSYLADANNPNTAVTMPAANVSVTASYEDIPVNNHTLSVINGSGDGDYEEGTVIDIVADAAPNGQQFAGWSGNISYVADANSASTFVTMPATNISVTASYEDVTTNCDSYATPQASDWILRNNWADQDNGTTLSNSNGELLVSQHQWANSYFYLIMNGTGTSISSGTDYTVSFDIKESSNVEITDVAVGFASGYQWDGPTGYVISTSSAGGSISSSSFTHKEITLSALSSGTGYLTLDVALSGQPSQATSHYLKNVDICTGTTKSAPAITSVEEESLSMKIYPNPTNNILNLILPANELYKIQLISTDGKIVHQNQFYGKKKQLIVGKLRQGLYIIKVITDNNVLIDHVLIK